MPMSDGINLLRSSPHLGSWNRARMWHISRTRIGGMLGSRPLAPYSAQSFGWSASPTPIAPTLAPSPGYIDPNHSFGWPLGPYMYNGISKHTQNKQSRWSLKGFFNNISEMELVAYMHIYVHKHTHTYIHTYIYTHFHLFDILIDINKHTLMERLAVSNSHSHYKEEKGGR